MVGGTCAITANADGSPNVTGTGLAKARAAALAPVRAAGLYPIATVGQTSHPFSPAGPATTDMVNAQLLTVQKIYANLQAEMNADSDAIVLYVQTNGYLTVPAAGLLDSGGHACTGTAHGTIA